MATNENLCIWQLIELTNHSLADWHIFDYKLKVPSLSWTVHLDAWEEMFFIVTLHHIRYNKHIQVYDCLYLHCI